MFLSRHQKVGQVQDIVIPNTSFENISQFKYLGLAVRNRNQIRMEMKRRLNSGNACYSWFCFLVWYEIHENLNIEDDNFECGSVWM
jgi:hypothetical protein